MSRAALVALLFLTACGGGGGGSPGGGPPPPPPPPPCCESTALIAAGFDTDEQNERAIYDTRSENTQQQHAGAGTFFSGAFLTDMRTNGILAAQGWADRAFATVEDHADMELDGPAITDLVEEHRGTLIAYVLADYDATTSGGGWPAGAVSQNRQDMVDGMNAAFDQLLADLAAAGYI